MAETLIERFTADGSYVRVDTYGDNDEHLSLLAHEPHKGQPQQPGTGSCDPAGLEPEEATEIGLKLLRWAATKVGNENERALVKLALDRVSRYVGAAL